MKNVLSFVLGLFIMYGVMTNVYGALVNTEGLSQLAASGYKLGCAEAKGKDCAKKTEKYRIWIKKVMELI